MAGAAATGGPGRYGYNIARMRYEILLAPQAVEDLRRLRANVRSQVRDSLELHLRHQPQKQSRTRIKRLKGITRPQYRLRVGEVRVFYDVSETSVEVLAILGKKEVSEWLERRGRRG
ncbi:MAG: type II toxin-antitoxin system RelE family toxin [Thermoanaerobaculia bacterium]